MKWRDSSEIVAGFVIKDRLDPNLVNPDDLFPPYGEIIKLKRDEKEITDLVMSDKIGFAAVSACVHAVETVNGEASPLEWLKILETASSRAKSGVDLERIAKDLKDGKEVDIGSIMMAAGRIDTGYRDLTPLSEVKPQAVKFVETGYKPLDKHIGGLPYACMTIIGGPPGVSKTTLALRILANMNRKYKKKKAALFSLEMTMGQIAQRYIELDKEMTKDEKERIIVGDGAYNVHEVYAVAAKAAASQDLSAIAIDFADLLVEGEQTESSMGIIYRNLSMLAKKTEVPVILVSQLNRETYKGGIPKINHLRYSGLAEATARLILLIHNPNVIVTDFDQEKSPLPSVAGRAYLVVGKSNFGYLEGGPGGILVDWDGATGWGDRSHGYFKLAG